MHEILWKTKFVSERLKIGVAKLLNDIPQQKRQGNTIARTIVRGIDLTKQSNHTVTNIITQQRFLSNLAIRLEHADEAAKVCAEFEEFRAILCHPKNLRIQVVSNLLSLKNPKNPWKTQFLPIQYSGQVLFFSLPKLKNQKNFLKDLPPIKYTKEFTSPKAKKGISYIFGMSAIDNSFLFQTGACPSSFDDEDLAPLMVLIE